MMRRTRLSLPLVGVIGAAAAGVWYLGASIQAHGLPEPLQRIQQMRQHGVPEQKLEALQEEAEWYLEGAKTPPAKPPAAPPPEDPWPDMQSGIFDESGDIFPSSYTIINFWQGRVGRDRVLVGAAAPAAAGETGQLLVQVWSAESGALAASASYPLPGTGEPRIVSANGPELQVATSAGGRWAFNVVTRDFRALP